MWPGESPVLAHRARGRNWSLAESERVLTSRSDPFGLSQAEAFGNSLEDSVSSRFPSWLSLDGALLLREVAPLSARLQALRGGEDWAVLPGKWRVLARQGWEGEKNAHSGGLIRATSSLLVVIERLHE